jgi:pimeloyl-ACP methyl ester carboxylesterase
MRQYAGFATAEETNERFRYLLANGAPGLSMAFDLPTQLGMDSDDPRALGEVGRVGVAIDSLDDMLRVFDGIPLDEVSTSMTINAPAAVLLLLYRLVGESQGVAPEELRGTIQNDVLKEYIARGNYIFPPHASMRLTTDTFAYCAAEMPRFNTISISGYHIREAGSTAVQEVAFTLADGQFSNPSPGRDDVVWRAWVPERGAEPGAAPALVVMLHGFSANLNSLSFQSERLASHGFAVIALTFPNAGFTDPPAQDLKVLEVQALVDLALAVDGPFGGNLNAEQIAIAGHSLGGKIAFFTAASDARVDLVIGMDPNNGGGPPCFIGAGCNDFPVAPNCESGDVGVVGQIRAESLVFATEDAALTPDAHLRAGHFYRGAPAPSHMLHFAKWDALRYIC